MKREYKKEYKRMHTQVSKEFAMLLIDLTLKTFEPNALKPRTVCVRERKRKRREQSSYQDTRMQS